jgi:N-acetylglucosamine-6-phosphate deacetylase
MNGVMLKNAFVVTAKGVERRDIILRNGQIDLSGAKIECSKIFDLAGRYILPGFVDIHMHGYELFNFSFGLYDPSSNTYNNNPDVYENCFDKLRGRLPEFGVTGFYLASLVAPLETLRHCYGRLAGYLGKSGNPAGARLFGGLLEGPFVNPEKAGAMNPGLILEPSKDAFDRIEDNGTVKLANVVPDSGEKSCKLTEYLTGKGIVVGAGHTGATYNQVADAVKAGLKYCIHFTNQTGGAYKPFDGGGAIEAVLKFDELFAELIVDGYHISPDYVRDIIKRKGSEKIIGVTDCSFAAGSSLKKFKSGGVGGEFSDDRKYIAVEGRKNTLYGSSLTMNRGFENVLNWLTSEMKGVWNSRHSALTFEDALVMAAAICSGNACRLTGLRNEGFGQIADGAKADIAVLDIAGSQGSYKVQVELTIVDGKVVYSHRYKSRNN